MTQAALKAGQKADPSHGIEKSGPGVDIKAKVGGPGMSNQATGSPEYERMSARNAPIHGGSDAFPGGGKKMSMPKRGANPEYM